MKKIYLALMALALTGGAISQTVSIGTSTDPVPSGNTYRTPWSPVWGYSYVQTIYLQSEINTAGTITSVTFNYAGESLANSNEITMWMGTITRAAFATTADWEPIGNMTQVFTGTISPATLPGAVTVNLTAPFAYNNTQNLVIAVHESKPDFDDNYFHATETGTTRTIYRVDDEEDPDPANPPATADAIRTKVGNIQITFGALPVTLGNFSGIASGNSNKLSWVTHSEQKNKGFELQRSADGTSFTSLAFVATKAQSGTSNSALSYDFNDMKPLRGNNYYRLKQLDLDGKATYSKVVMLKGSSIKGGLSVVYPNPTKNDLNMILSSKGNDKATIYITNVSGKVVYKSVKSIGAGDTKINVNASGFAAGVYTVKAIYASNNESAVSKFVKQ
jgi:hypothetical protein